MRATDLVTATVRGVEEVTSFILPSFRSQVNIFGQNRWRIMSNTVRISIASDADTRGSWSAKPVRPARRLRQVGCHRHRSTNRRGISRVALSQTRYRGDHGHTPAHRLGLVRR